MRSITRESPCVHLFHFESKKQCVPQPGLDDPRLGTQMSLGHGKTDMVREVAHERRVSVVKCHKSLCDIRDACRRRITQREAQAAAGGFEIVKRKLLH